MAEILGLPCIEMDALFWLPGWQQPAEEDFLAKVAAAVSGQEWVLDGNYTRTQAIKWAEVECVVWLDYSFARTTSQSLGRVIKRSLGGQEIWTGTGNRESFWQAFFSKKSILLWMLKSFRRTREKYRALMEEGGGRAFPVVRIGSREEAEELLRGLRR
ncbi:adenylate kinase [Haloferula sp. BvORR071]|uniref:adenylate kinase n=1 Tax=Haloferula sp. BvORR071 TaxID=1396141 RepID=UPI002240F10C|nr:adenylate kinase [Haloferula sp. BvORR071]